MKLTATSAIKNCPAGSRVSWRAFAPLLLALLLLGACNRQLSAETLAGERRALQSEITALRAEADSLNAANEEMRTRVAELVVLLENQQQELRGHLEVLGNSAETVQERSEGLTEQVEAAGEAAEDSQDVVNRALEEAAQEELSDIEQNVDERIEDVQETQEAQPEGTH